MPSGARSKGAAGESFSSVEWPARLATILSYEIRQDGIYQARQGMVRHRQRDSGLHGHCHRQQQVGGGGN